MTVSPAEMKSCVEMTQWCGQVQPMAVGTDTVDESMQQRMRSVELSLRRLYLQYEDDVIQL